MLSLLLGRGVSLIRSPLIVGYILAGAIFGPAVLNLVNEAQIASLDIINLVVLSLIGFGIGGELRFSELQKLGKSIISIVILESLGAFLLVGIAVSLILKSIPMGLIYGSLASATAPAGTVEVIKQYRARGRFTTTLYAVVGLDDIVSLLLFTINLPLAMIFLDKTTGSDFSSVLIALGNSGLEIILSVLVGSISGLILISIGKLLHDRVSVLLFSISMILINCGISDYLSLSPILLNMTMGIIMVNFNSLISRKIFSALGDWSPPLYVWFFVLIGTRLNIPIILKFSLLIGIYIVARSFGKWIGVFLGSLVSKASSNIRNYLGLALMSQAGVAVGLSLAAAKMLETRGMHQESVQLISSIAATTFIVMLIGPILAKIALFKSGEIERKV
ncbi:MAG: cation:proton antiporter [Candidatus Cloacimonetes bacterium]|nr:cation:proton antiporter [Candidatus Cloacimonadota bacterium]